MYKKTILVTALCVVLFTPGKAQNMGNTNNDSLINVPLGGNAWRIDKDTLGGRITDDGITDWSDKNATFKLFVRFGQTGKIKLYLNLVKPAPNSSFSVTVDGAEQVILTAEKTKNNLFVGGWNIRDTGYVAFEIKGRSVSGSILPQLKSLTISGAAVTSKTNYVKDNEGQFFYWGRRGPSVHLGYTVPNNVNAEWFYNEVTVPVGNDILGSYFMACGFGEGYFGMQVNSATERHILFSVWSPFNTDDPKKIPDDEKIIMLKKGENVHTGEFGNEGSGGQSYMNYIWKAGNNYRFLVHAKPTSNGRTEYTAYFYAPESGKWTLLASFSRPKTNTYLKHLHSFLENFEPETGLFTRSVHFNNEWVCDSNGNWIELTNARFTGDNTAVKGYRMDYAGGITGNEFYLKNCGFFNNYTPRNIYFERPASGKKPDVDLSKLP